MRKPRARTHDVVGGLTLGWQDGMRLIRVHIERNSPQFNTMIVTWEEVRGEQVPRPIPFEQWQAEAVHNGV